MKQLFLNVLLVLACIMYVGKISASKRNSFAMPKAPKSYVKKAPYAGMGKSSSVNGMPKTKCVSGHTKRTSKGCTYVNPYAKSK